jgi:hypothetical protein
VPTWLNVLVQGVDVQVICLQVEPARHRLMPVSSALAVAVVAVVRYRGNPARAPSVRPSSPTPTIRRSAGSPTDVFVLRRLVVRRAVRDQQQHVVQSPPGHNRERVALVPVRQRAGGMRPPSCRRSSRRGT